MNLTAASLSISKERDMIKKIFWIVVGLALAGGGLFFLWQSLYVWKSNSAWMDLVCIGFLLVYGGGFGLASYNIYLLFRRRE